MDVNVLVFKKYDMNFKVIIPKTKLEIIPTRILKLLISTSFVIILINFNAQAPATGIKDNNIENLKLSHRAYP